MPEYEVSCAPGLGLNFILQREKSSSSVGECHVHIIQKEESGVESDTREGESVNGRSLNQRLDSSTSRKYQLSEREGRFEDDLRLIV